MELGVFKSLFLERHSIKRVFGSVTGGSQGSDPLHLKATEFEGPTNHVKRNWMSCESHFASPDKFDDKVILGRTAKFVKIIKRIRIRTDRFLFLQREGE